MTDDLFADLLEPPRTEPIAPGAVVLRGFARSDGAALAAAVRAIVARAPFRHMITPGGQKIAVALTNCGAAGWISDRRGYRYGPTDPESGKPWPPLPALFSDLATRAAAAAGYPGFAPDACLINRYEPGTKLSLHQDKNERDFSAPIVSVSLGLPATFLFGGAERRDRALRIPLMHGDVAVWGGPARLTFHGVAALKDGNHPLLGHQRINLTFRKAL